ncbi:transcriptional regulator, ArsR family [Cnuella takakiae]|uniref:Transcriptional regulator, ArsR family n=1 Tax=Cnuella takakiae TaxID=1302690 RepID=A0A1M5GGN1_9BACT|nr:metalloregulator ArsR/SmtB family transcription factor [Cnuella takakiae]OLY92413.1 hypothetical protein BUE76_11315 [Cnuella takakiae]SHG02848.1 transcriptional regulator, ArsR family [Cnuella takakiae]
MLNKPSVPTEGNNAPLLQGEELQLRKAHYLLKALDHRLRIDMILFIHDKGSCTVTDIFISFRLVQAVASQHLAILRRANLVHTERQGKNIYYSLNYPRLNQMLHLIGGLS